MPAPAAWRRFFVALPILLVSLLAFTLLESAPTAHAQVSKQDRVETKRERKLEKRQRMIKNRKRKIRHGVQRRPEPEGRPVPLRRGRPGLVRLLRPHHVRLPQGASAAAAYV